MHTLVVPSQGVRDALGSVLVLAGMRLPRGRVPRPPAPLRNWQICLCQPGCIVLKFSDDQRPAHRRNWSNASQSAARWLHRTRSPTLSYDIAKESFDVIVPTAYKPGPPARAVHLGRRSATSRRLAPILARHKLIVAVGQRHATSGRLVVRRPRLALDAVHNLSQHVRRRRHAASTSPASPPAGSSRPWLLRGFPEVFSGVCCFMGGEFYCRATGSTRRAVVDRKSTSPGTATSSRSSATPRSCSCAARRTARRGRSLGAVPTRSRCGSTVSRRVRTSSVPNSAHRPPTGPWFEQGDHGAGGQAQAARRRRAHDATAKPRPDQLAQARRLLSGRQVRPRNARADPSGDVNASRPRFADVFRRAGAATSMQVLADLPDDARREGSAGNARAGSTRTSVDYRGRRAVDDLAAGVSAGRTARRSARRAS